MNLRLLFLILFFSCSFFSCSFYNRKLESYYHGHCILIDMRENNKVNNSFLLSTSNDTSYYRLYDYADHFDYINDFEKEVTYVIPKRDFPPCVIDIGLFVDIRNGVTTSDIDNSTFLSIKGQIISKNTFIDSLTSSSYHYGVGLFDTKDSLFYILNDKDTALELFENIEKILHNNNYNVISEQLKNEVIDNMKNNN